MAHRTAALLAEAGWHALLDRILLRVGHDLNGRLAAMEALQQLVELGDVPTDSLRREAERLEALSRLVARLPADLGAERSAFSLGGLLERALEVMASLDRTEEGVAALRLDEEAPPVLVNEGRCFRGLLLYVDWVHRSGVEGSLVFEVRGDPDTVEVRCALGSDDVDSEPLERLSRVFALDGGSVGLDEVLGARLSLPSLARARAGGY